MRPSLPTLSLTLALAAALATPAAALAQDCPAEIPSSSRDRRALAKEWFGRAEAAESANNPIAAAKAYQCSLRIVPHAFTAFNLGRLAEKTGDLELAVEAFNTYLQLAPEAQDKPEIEAKIAALNVRIAALRNEQNAPVGPPVNPPVADPSPPVPTPPLPDLKPPPSETPPRLTETTSASEPSSGWKVHPGVYVASGVGVAALVGGIVLNIQARSKMDDCRALAASGMTEPADKACKAAKPRAYASYALFGVTAAAAVADAVLIWMSVKNPGAERVSLRLVGDGATVGTTWRF